jgi:hypothetical protein
MKTASQQLAVNALKLCQRELAAWMTEYGQDISSLQALADSDAAIAAIETDSAQPVGGLDARGRLAAKLSCWHRLTEVESDEMVALFAAQDIAQPVEPKRPDWYQNPTSESWFGRVIVANASISEAIVKAGGAL